MNNQDILKTFISKCKDNLLPNKKIITLLNKKGIKESFIFENINLGFIDQHVYQSIGGDPKILDIFETTGLYKKSKPVFDKKITNNSILSPEELEKKLNNKTNLNILNIPAYSGV